MSSAFLVTGSEIFVGYDCHNQDIIIAHLMNSLICIVVHVIDERLCMLC